MFPSPLLLVFVMLLFPAGEPPENPWKEKVPEAVKQAERRSTTAALREAFDVIWRADDWQAGLKLAERSRSHADDAKLRGSIMRALWRAGHMVEAERLAERIPLKSDDAVALRTGIEIQLARGRMEAAGKLAARLEALRPQSAEDLYQLFGYRLATNKLEGLADMLREAQKLTDPKNGYPETYVGEAIDGVAEFLDAVGLQPLNGVSHYGSAPMPPLVMLNLPSCDVLINGHGPYRMVVDTGGSITVALDETVASEIGLKSIAKASIRGVSGKQETGQCLIDDLQIGTIKCGRVVTRTFDVHSAILNAADGIIGTGIFSQARMTLDFAGGQLVISPSSDRAAVGRAVELRLVSDAKLMSPVTLQGQPAVALLDSGADAVALAPSRLKQLFPNREVEEFGGGIPIGVGSGEGPQISLSSGVRLEFAGRTFENYGGLGLDVLDNVLSPVLGVQTDILLGMPTFRTMKSCTVDFPKCKMWIVWLDKEPDSLEQE
jgi:hypothetical protein